MSDTENNQDFLEKLKEDYSDPVFLELLWKGRKQDWLLQDLVEMVNDSSMPIGITLSTGSGLISGILVSVDEYFELLAESFSAGLQGSELRNFFCRKSPRKFLLKKSSLLNSFT